MRRLALLLATVVVAVSLPALGVTAAATATAAAVPAQFTDALLASIPSPTAIAFMPDGRMLVATQPGQLRVIVNGSLLAAPAIDLKPVMCTNSERGLLGVATDPDPATNAIFVFYTSKGTNTACPTNSDGSVMPAGVPHNRASRFVLRADNTIDPASETVLLDGILSPAGYHNAGDLHVGKDGLLYVSTGDGGCDYLGGAGNAGGSGCGGANDASRDRNILNGKILRVTLTGAVPADNPFTGAGTVSCRTAPAPTGVTCQEAFATGLRNPFRMAFDPNATATVFRIDDVGQDVWEEIDQGTKGADYGWNVREGHCAQTGIETDCGAPKPAQYTDPIYDYGHSTGCKSITGGAFVPSGVWPTAYTGAYLYSDYVCGTVTSLSASLAPTDFITGLGTSSAVALAFGPTAAGLAGAPQTPAAQSLYYTSYAGGGQIHRVTFTGTANRAPVAVLSATPSTGAAPLRATLSAKGSSDPDGDALSYLWSFGDGTPDATTTNPAFTHTYKAGTFTATLRVRDPSKLVSAPVTVRISAGNTAPVATIQSPSATGLFTAGLTYVLKGTATDAEDGVLPASSMSWSIVRRHDTHQHPFLGPVTGNSISFVAPGPEDLAAAANSDLFITLTVTDSQGVTTSTSQPFSPLKVAVKFATTPTGSHVSVNGLSITGTTTVTSWAGFELQLDVPRQVDASGQAYAFAAWSDGRPAAHSVVTPSSATLLTARLTARGQVATAPTAVTVTQPAAGSAAIAWQPPASSGSAPITGYRVSRDGIDSTGAGPYTYVLPATARSYTMTKLVTGQTYTLQVQAVTSVADGVAAGAPVTIAAR